MDDPTNAKIVSWKSIWAKKGKVAPRCDSLTLDSLIAIDGFDSKAGFIHVDSWKKYAADIGRRLDIKLGSSLLEVGCGAGAFLSPFASAGVDVYGIDYTEELIDIAMFAIPGGVFRIAEAKFIPFNDNFFDVVISNAVFFYFPSLSYAESAFKEIVRVLKPGGQAAILDISDVNVKEAAEELRAREIGADEYNKLYVVPGLSHLYFDRSWFLNLGQNCGVDISIQDQFVEGYRNASYRFNVYLKKSVMSDELCAIE